MVRRHVMMKREIVDLIINIKDKQGHVVLTFEISDVEIWILDNHEMVS